MVRALAEQLGVPYVEREVRVADNAGNLEAAARQARYAALADMATEAGIRYVATAHHAEDQLETLLMSFLRGTGAGGMRGLAVSRGLSGKADAEIRLIRPMASEVCGMNGVEIDRAVCRRLCTTAGVAWREDATNLDGSRLRNAIRAEIVPVLRKLRPDVLSRGVTVGGHARAVERLMARESDRVLRAAAGRDGELCWAREVLRGEDVVVLGALFRRVRRELCGACGADRGGKRSIDAIARAIRDGSTDTRRFMVGGVRVVVTAHDVTMAGGVEAD